MCWTGVETTAIVETVSLKPLVLVDCHIEKISCQNVVSVPKDFSL